MPSNLQNDLRKALEKMYRGYDFPYDEINALVTKIGGAVAAESFGVFAKQFPNSIAKPEPWLGEIFDRWRKNEIMRLISIQQNEQLKIGRLINNARAEGKALGNLVKAYTADRSRKHAVFEMRNARENFQGEITKNRMMEHGIDCYKWLTSGDETVRDTHREMEGKICRWDDPTVMYDEKTKTWVPRNSDMVHKHPQFDYNCRCSALAYLMEIDEETGEYGKGTDNIEEINEYLNKEESNDDENVFWEVPIGMKAEPEGFARDILEKKGTLWRASDVENAKKAEQFLGTLTKVRAQNDPLLNGMLGALGLLNKRMKAEGKIGFQFVFRKGTVAYYEEGKIYQDISEWDSPSIRQGGNKLQFKSLFHEMFHAVVDVNKTFKKEFLNNLSNSVIEDMAKIQGFTELKSAKKEQAKELLPKIWSHFVKIAKAHGNEYWESSLVPITDFTHGMLAEPILRKDMLKLFSKIDGVVINEHKRMGFHDSNYYIDLKRFESKNGSVAADEFLAHTGSLYFTDRELFNAYEKELPNSLGMVGAFIKHGGNPEINLYLPKDKP